MILSDVWYVCSIPWGLRGCEIDTIPACSQLLCCRWFLPQHNIVLSAHMFQCVDLNEKARTNRGKPGLALFWRLANTWVRTAGRCNRLDRTTQSRTEAHDCTVQQRWTDFTCYASPSISQRRQWRQQCAEAKSSNIWCSIKFLWTPNWECRKHSKTLIL